MVKRNISRPGAAAAISTLLAFAVGVLTNLATARWTWSVGAGLVLLGGAWAGFEMWRLGRLDPGRSQAVAMPAARAIVGRRVPWMAPPLDRIVERPEVGELLLASLVAPGQGQVSLTAALQGAVGGGGGWGKTTLAAWVACRPEIRDRYPGGLLWVTVGQEVHGADLAERVNDLAWVLSGRRPAIVDPDVAGAELGRLLDEQADPVLLVVDDVWEEAQLRAFRFGGRACTRLVTTRIGAVLSSDWVSIPVRAMSPDQARLLLTDDVGGLSRPAADRLAAAAGYWPVLLHLLNGALGRRVARGQPPEEAAELIAGMLAVEGPAAFDPALPADRGRAVAATVEASLALLSDQDRDRCLDLAVFPEDVDLPVEVLALLWPERRPETLCEDLVELGLASDYRLDLPGPRLILHDLVRAYLRHRRRGPDRDAVHCRFVDAATNLLQPGPDPHLDHTTVRWWTLPESPNYLWRYLPYHLHEAGRRDELAELVVDLRWIEAKTRRFGSITLALADLDLANSPTAAQLRQALAADASLLGPIDPPEALGATLASRLDGISDLEPLLRRYRLSLPRPRLEPARPLPDRPDAIAALDAGFGHIGDVWSCAFSPNGTLLASVSSDGTARIWNVADGAQRHILRGHTGTVWTCVFSRRQLVGHRQ